MTHQIEWEENGLPVQRLWISQSHLSPPKKISTADDTLKADIFYQAASQGSAFVWRSDFQNAKQLLQAVERRIESQASRKKTSDIKVSKDLFHLHRQAQAHRAQLLSRLLISIEPDLSLTLRRAPDIKAVISEALGPADLEQAQKSGFVMSLRELLGFIGAHEWRKKGVKIQALENTIHPFYGVFSPARGEYLDLVAQAPLPPKINQAFDIGTGTGVIAAILAKRGVKKIIATELNPQAIECAKENIERLGYEKIVKIEKTDLFPPGEADLIVCNPPWVPARPTSPIELAVYDEDSKMLKAFLAGAAKHLSSKGEAWLIMSDLAEHLGLRAADEILKLIEAGGLKLIERLETRPRHEKARDSDNLLYQARSKEITSLWRLSRS
jgi:16S rRNA G1207 methylase RsmC